MKLKFSFFNLFGIISPIALSNIYIHIFKKIYKKYVIIHPNQDVFSKFITRINYISTQIIWKFKSYLYVYDYYIAVFIFKLGQIIQFIVAI